MPSTQASMSQAEWPGWSASHTHPTFIFLTQQAIGKKRILELSGDKNRDKCYTASVSPYQHDGEGTGEVL